MKKHLLKIWFLIFVGQLFSLTFVYLTMNTKMFDKITLYIHLVYFCLYTFGICCIYLYKTKFRKNGKV